MRYLQSTIVLFSFLLLAQNIVSNDKYDMSEYNEFLKKAKNYYYSSSYDSSIHIYKFLLEELDPDLDTLDYLSCVIGVASGFIGVGNVDSVKFYTDVGYNYISKYQISDSRLLLQLGYLKSYYHYKVRELDSALIYLKLAENHIKPGFTNDSISSLISKLYGNVNFYLRNIEDALKYFKQSLSIEKQRDNSSEESISSVMQNIGIAYSTLKEYDSARYYFDRSLKLKENILSPRNPKLANGYQNFALFLSYVGDPHEALKLINKAEQLYLSIYDENNMGLAPLYINKGLILTTLLNYEEALNYMLLAFDIYQKNNIKDIELLSAIYWNIGRLYHNTSQFDKAISYFNETKKVDNDNLYLIKANRWIADCYFRLDKYEMADNYYQNAINDINYNLSKDNLDVGYTYLNYGSFCCEIEEKDTAFKYFNKAIPILKSVYGDYNSDVSLLFTEISSYFLKIGEYKNAITFSQKALTSYDENFTDSNFYKNPGLDLLENNMILLNALFQKASAFYKFYYFKTNDLNDLLACFETASLAVELFEQIKSTIGGEYSKLLASEDADDAYELAYSSAIELYKSTNNSLYLHKSFEFSERTKAAVLLSLLREGDAFNIGNIPDEIKHQEQQLKKEMLQYQNIIYEENQKNRIDSLKVSRIRKQLVKRKLEYDSLILAVEENFPEYFTLKYSNDAISISEIQNKLNKNEVLVEYRLIDSILYSFIINVDTIHIGESFVGADFNEAVLDYVKLLSNSPMADSISYRSHYFASRAYNLYQQVQLNDALIKNAEKLIIIPDGILGYLSFEALVTQPPAQKLKGYRGLPYVINDYTISYGNSATLYFKENVTGDADRNLLAIAPDYQDLSKMDNEQDQDFREFTSQLKPLKYTSEEVNRVSDIFNGNVFIGSNASEKNFKEHSDEYKILHFAMHAFVNDEDPLSSKLIFSMDEDTIEDGFLNTYEIYNLDLNAELAVLSACKTGVGKLNKGEGIMSLARGFLYAGVPSVVMTLWEVEDYTSAEIIAKFYEFLKVRDQKHTALRKAKLDYLANANQFQSHPYFWAAYVQIGDHKPISIKKQWNRSIIIGSGLIALIILLIVLRKIRLKS